MYSKKFYRLIFLVILISLIESAYAQPFEVWNVSYDGGSNDRAFGIAVDNSGNVYVTGSSFISGNRHFYTIMYKPDGSEVWNASFGGGSYDDAFDITVDSNSYVYVTGDSYFNGNFNYYTIKYDLDGKELWNASYDGGPADKAKGITVDSNGYVYVTGTSSLNGDFDYYTIKYDSDGKELWNAIYDGGIQDIANDVAVDCSNNVYVTGYSHHGGNINYYTIKYDSDGNELWNVTYDGGSTDEAFGIAIDCSGNVFVTGLSEFDGDYDYYTIKYDSDGNELWNATYDGGIYDLARGVAVDCSGNVYITGYSDFTGKFDYSTIMYDPDGNEVWNASFDGGSDNKASSIEVDCSGNVYVTGHTDMGGDLDYYTIKYSQEGMYEPEAVIGDLVWNDLNENGIQDAGEPGISDVTVELYNCNDNLIASNTTDANGLYSFTVPADDYYLKFTFPSGIVISPMDQGMNDAIDSDADLITGQTVCTTLAPGENDPAWDVGMFEANPAITIEKATNGVDADMEPGIILFLGSSIEWTYIVENTGNVILTNIAVTDNIIGDICTIDILEPGESHTCTANGIVEPEQYVNIGTGASEYDGMTVSDTDLSHYYGVMPPGTGGSGYWKNHPEAWPVDEVTIGGVIYTKEEAINIFKMPGGDKTYTIFRALVSAKLNVLIGNDDSCIAYTISEADVWMETYRPVGSGIHAKSDAWKEGEPLYCKLDDYNNGELPCAHSRD